MPEIEGLARIQSKMRELRAKSRKDDNGSVIVGYNANYAVFVHELVDMKLKGKPRIKWLTNKTTKQPFIVRDKSGEPIETGGNYWDPQGRGQAKFLEQPAREKQKEMARVLQEAFSNGTGLLRSLFIAGTFLQRESQKLVPVDTGNLKGSAFTEFE